MSSAARFVARSQRARQRGSQVLFVFAVGVIAATTLALLAGARRSSSVIDRFFSAIPTYDAQIYSENSSIGLEALQSIPEVVLAQPTPYMSFNLIGPDVDPENGGINSTTGDFTQVDPTARVLRGSIPTDDMFAAVVNEVFVDQFGLDVGDTFNVASFANTPEQFDEIAQGVYNPTGPHYQFRIAAVISFAQQLATNETVPVAGTTQVGSESQNEMVLSQEFWLAHHSEFIDFGSSFNIRLANGADDYERFVTMIEALDPAVLSRPWTPDVEPNVFQSSVALETGVLLGVAIGAALAGVALVLVLVRVQQRRFEDDRTAQVALGFTRTEHVHTAVWRIAPAAIATAVTAATVAIALSGQFPVGVGKELELNPGVEVNLAVIVMGATVTLLMPIAIAALLAGSRAARTKSSSRVGRPPRWTRKLSVEPSLGVRLALGDPARGGRRANVLGLVVGTVAATCALTVVLWVHAADHLYATPSARGWMWDLAIGNTNFPIDPDAAQAVSSSPEVSALTTATFGSANLDGRDIFLLGFDPDGTAPPSIIAGWLPTSDHEIALSARLMKQLHVELGDEVTLALAGWDFREEIHDAQPTKFTVVGQSVSPELDGDFVRIAVVTFGGFSRAGVAAEPRVLLVRVQDSDRQQALTSLISPLTQDTMGDRIPTRVVSLHRVRTLPLIGAALAMLLTLVTLVAGAVAAAQRNRYALGVLSALGLHRRGIQRVAAWQGVVTGLVIAAVACPVAVLAASIWWRQVAAGLGLRADLALPVWLLAATLGAVLTAATMTALATSAGSGRRLSGVLRVG